MQANTKYLTKRNSTYDERAQTQLRLWQAGVPVHNDIDNECCPDFSCCHGGQARLAPERLRNMFVRDPASRRAIVEMFIAELPDEIRMLYDLPGQAVFSLERN